MGPVAKLIRRHLLIVVSASAIAGLIHMILVFSLRGYDDAPEKLLERLLRARLSDPRLVQGAA
jgi:hypothetical protein